MPTFEIDRLQRQIDALRAELCELAHVVNLAVESLHGKIDALRACPANTVAIIDDDFITWHKNG